ncbi:hypothetical protein WJX73_004671 [Symbiochloris irregularis]|uniref:Uncharacterized protein n=1 Tax=Symbiochloris irregularis TaxID=706552 RepID=A0AAW1P1N3_9CHLO
MVQWSENVLFEDVSEHIESEPGRVWLSGAIAAEQQLALTAKLQRQRLSHCCTTSAVQTTNFSDVQHCLQEAEQQAEHLLRLSVAIQARCRYYERTIQQQPKAIGANKTLVDRQKDKMARLKRILLQPSHLSLQQAEQLTAVKFVNAGGSCPMCHQPRASHLGASGFSLRGTRQEVHALQRQVGQLQWALHNAGGGESMPLCASAKGQSSSPDPMLPGKTDLDSLTRLQAADQAIQDSIARISLALTLRNAS